MPESGGGRGAGRAQEFFDAGVSQDDIRRPLQGLIVTAFEAITFFRRTQHRAGFREEFLRRFYSGVVLIFEDDVDAYDKVRQRVKPGEPGVIHDELQQLPGGGDAPVNPFIGELLGDNQRFVQS